MGLLDRLRPGRETAVPPAPTEPPTTAAAQPTPSPRSDDVIRADTFRYVPEWAKVPPPQSVLPPMPVVLSERKFEQLLVTRHEPPRFLGELGHVVSAAAPSGIVEAIGVLVPPATASQPGEAAADVAAAATSELTLAPQPGATRGRQPQASVRRLAAPAWADNPPDPYQAAPDPAGPADISPAGELPLAGRPPEPPSALEEGPEPSSAGGGPAGSPPPGSAAPGPGTPDGLLGSAGLLGSSPMAPPAEPVAVLQPLAPPSQNRLMNAPVPADLPLVSLRAEPGPPPDVRRLAVPDLPADSPLTGDWPMVAEAGPAPGAPAEAPPAAGTLAAAASPASAPVSRPLAPTPATPPPAGPGAGAGTALSTDADLPLAPLASARSGSDTPPVRPVPPDGDGQAEASGEYLPPPAAAAPAPPAATAEHEAEGGPPAGPGAPATGDAVAPLIGATAAAPASGGGYATPTGAVPGPEASAEQLSLPRPAGSGRSGLGAPLDGLPPTAMSWDISSMSHAEQVRMSRALIESRTAAQMSTIGMASGERRTPAPPGTVPAAAAMPLAPAPSSGAGPRPGGPSPAGTTLRSATLESLAPRPSGSAPGVAELGVGPEVPLLAYRPIADADGAFPAPATSPGPEPVEGQRTRAEVGARVGMDLTAVPVDRSPRGAAEAGTLHARAFTSDRGVVVPRSAGDLDSGPGAALLAHELTHVAQRSRLGANIPDESTPAGRLLEAEARGAELALSPGGAARALSSPPGGTEAMSVAAPAAAPSLRSMIPSSQALPLAPPASPPGSALDTDALAATIIEKISVLSPSPTSTIETVVSPWAAGPSPVAAAPAGVQRAAESTPPVQAPAAPPDDVEAVGATMSRPSDADLSNLSRWLYPLIRFRLKGELREDRERAGMLTDHYRKW